MPTKNEIYKEILKSYDKSRTLAEERLKSNKKAVYTAVPKIEEIDNKISKMGIDMAKLVIQNPEDRNLILEQIKNNISILNKEKKELLKQNKISEDFLKIKYKCEKCNDTGYIGTEKCSCFLQKIVDGVTKSSNLKNVLERENFDYFDFSLYSEKKYENEELSPLENMQKIFNLCINFVKEFDFSFNNLLFYGGTGLGKTFLCNCIAKDLLDKGVSVLYVTSTQLFKIFDDEQFDKDKDNTSDIRKNKLNEIFEVDLLIIDDLGTEFSTAFSSSSLFNVINSRLLEKRPVIISTNLKMNDFMLQYSDRVVSRIMGNYTTLHFFGSDIRILKKINTISQ